MSWQYGTHSILSKSYGTDPETFPITAGQTRYTPAVFITHLDSIYGLFATLVGTRYGVNDVTITLQDATMPDAPTAAWTDVDGPVNFGTAGSGTIGSPTSVYAIAPFASSNGTIKPYIRFKIVAGAASGATFTGIYRTMRGLK